MKRVLLSNTRWFHASGVMFKPKNQNDQLLSNLGASLQKGEIQENNDNNNDNGSNNNNNNNNNNSNDEGDKLVGIKDNYKKLQDYYNSISYMSIEDLMIQQNLDEGKQFKSFPSEHYLDRKQLLKDIPDEIDIRNTPLSKIHKIYKNLDKLDEDKTVHLKYYKRYLNNYADPIIHLLQEFNGINEKFKLLRRNELDSLSLNPGSYLYKENLFNLPYNVVGFDKSISGFPLRTGKHRLTDISYPQEFIQDLTTNKDKIKVHKKDLDFIEFNENSSSINPSNLISPHDSVFNTPLQNHNQKFDRFINLIYNELEVPKNFILVDNINDYKILKFRFLNKFNSILETEINTLKGSLQKEIELVLSSGNSSNNLLLFNQQFFKTNAFKLCDFLRDNDPSSANNNHSNGDGNESEAKGKNPGLPAANVLIISYNIKEFNLIPYNYLINKSRRTERKLFNHLYKLFLINLTDQIETLSRLKYSNKKQIFLNNLNVKISNTIKYKLMNLLHSINEFKTIPVDETVIFKPYGNKNFKRVYNYRTIPLSRHKKSSFKMKLIDLEVLHKAFS